jgi:hypothetical protein
MATDNIIICFPSFFSSAAPIKKEDVDGNSNSVPPFRAVETQRRVDYLSHVVTGRLLEIQSGGLIINSPALEMIFLPSPFPLLHIFLPNYMYLACMLCTEEQFGSWHFY